MELFGRCLAWLGFLFVRGNARGCLFVTAAESRFCANTKYVLVVAVLAGLPYLILVVLNRLILGAFAWLPWRARNVRNS